MISLGVNALEMLCESFVLLAAGPIELLRLDEDIRHHGDIRQGSLQVVRGI
jgi:hypothetical protein